MTVIPLHPFLLVQIPPASRRFAWITIFEGEPFSFYPRKRKFVDMNQRLWQAALWRRTFRRSDFGKGSPPENSSFWVWFQALFWECSFRCECLWPNMRIYVPFHRSFSFRNWTQVGRLCKHAHCVPLRLMARIVSNVIGSCTLMSTISQGFNSICEPWHFLV